MKLVPEKSDAPDPRSRCSDYYKKFVAVARQGWVTDRDIKVLEMLYKFRFVSLSQIAKTFYKSTYGKVSARRRMKKLFENHLVDRFKPWPKYGEGASEYIYCLDTAGVYFIASTKGMKLSEMGWRKNDNEIRFAYVLHYLAVADVFIQMDKECRIEQFIPERKYQNNFRADAYAVFLKQGRRHYWLIEVDLGTEWQQQIKEKVRSYEQYHNKRKGDKGFIMPYVVWMAYEQDRLDRLEGWVDESKKINLPYLYKKISNREE